MAVMMHVCDSSMCVMYVIAMYVIYVLVCNVCAVCGVYDSCVRVGGQARVKV